MSSERLGWVDGDRVQLDGSRGAFQLRWTQRMVAPFGDAYVPVEQATPAVDPVHDRLYVGSTTGTLWAMRGNGRRLYRYEAGSSLEAGPTLDRERNELYVVSEDGVVHALSARTGALRWKSDSAAGATRKPVVLVKDALYVASDTDQVVALARDNGEVLWRYRREPTDGYHVSGHAGLTLDGNRLYAAFSDGMIVALDGADGRVIWERDTALDFPPGEVGRGQRFVDVDTTPVRIGDVLYAASFSGGLYGLDPTSGSVASIRPEWTGINAIVPAENDLILATAEGAITRVEPTTGVVRWSVRASRGTPSNPILADDVLYLSETLGGFVARSVSSGVELSRIESGHGFTAAPAIVERRGVVISNGGTLYAFTTPNQVARQPQPALSGLSLRARAWPRAAGL